MTSVWGGGDGYRKGDTAADVARRSTLSQQKGVCDYIDRRIEREHESKRGKEGEMGKNEGEMEKRGVDDDDEEREREDPLMIFETFCLSEGKERGDEEGEVEQEVGGERREKEKSDMILFMELLNRFFEEEIGRSNSDAERATLIRTKERASLYFKQMHTLTQLSLSPSSSSSLPPLISSQSLKVTSQPHQHSNYTAYSELVPLRDGVTPDDVLSSFVHFLTRERLLIIDKNERAACVLFRSFDMIQLASLRRSVTGETILHFVCSFGYSRIALFLCGRGFPSLLASGKYPLHYLLEWLKRRGEEIEKERAGEGAGEERGREREREESDDVAELYRALLKGVPLSFSLPTTGVLDLQGGDTFLHSAVRFGAAKLVTILLEMEAEERERRRKEERERGEREVEWALRRNVNGETPLDLCVDTPSQNDEILRLLLASLPADRICEMGTHYLRSGGCLSLCC